MKKLLLSSLLMFVSLLCNDSFAQKVRVLPDLDNTKYITMMTYNIRHGKGMDGKVDLGRIATEIALINPDVVALQEVDYKTKRSNYQNTAQQIAELTKLGYSNIFGKGIDFDEGEYGNAILFKERPVAQTVIPLPGAEEERCLLVAEFPDFYFATCHLSLDADSRSSACYTINSVVKSIADGKYRKDGMKIFSGKNKPFYLLGDFNATPESTDIFVIQKSFYWLSRMESKSFPADKPDRLLDYIFMYKNKAGEKLMKEFDKGEKALACWVQPEDIASDHRPVILTIISGGKEVIIEEIAEDTEEETDTQSAK